MTDVSAMCLRRGCSNPVPSSPQNRLYCSKPCRRVVNSQRDYARRRELQGGQCVFCSRTDLYVDHDHFNGRFRGLLCMQHNGLLGHLGDGDPDRVNTFLNYLGLEPTRRVARP
jgi:hypothetical protein